MNNTRTRIAPSPTGLGHIGFLRSSIFNYLYAKKHGGVFYMRIEDTDVSRFNPDAEKDFMESLKWVGIEPDESPEKGGPYGPYRQSEREDIYKKYANILVEKGLAYWAFDTQEEVAAAKEKMGDKWNYGLNTRGIMRNSLTIPKEETEKLLNDNTVGKVLRFKVPENTEVEVNDLIHGVTKANSNTIDDKVLIKSDGGATFSLASIVDDSGAFNTDAPGQKTSIVLRGNEWLPSSFFHVLLYKAFGWTPPQFAHLPLINAPGSNKKLSKRDGAKYGFPVMVIGNSEFPGFKMAGYEPEAVFNYCALLGFSPGGDHEIYSKEELIQLFDISKVSKSSARFDIKKALWFNSQYLRKKSDEELSKILVEDASKKGYTTSMYSVEELKEIARISVERSELRNQMADVVSFFFKLPSTFDDKAMKKWTPEAAKALLNWIDSDSYKDNKWSNNDEIHHSLESICTPELPIGKIAGTLRLALTAGMPGPDLPSIMRLLGKVETYNRIKTVVEKLS